jgi:hypothetical protein
MRSALLAGGDHSAALFSRHGHRLLAEHVLAVGGSGQHVLAMQVYWAGYVHRVHLWIGEQRFHLVVVALRAELASQQSGPFPVPDHQRPEPAFGMRFHRRHHPTLGHAASAKHSPLHHALSPVVHVSFALRNESAVRDGTRSRVL